MIVCTLCSWMIEIGCDSSVSLSSRTVYTSDSFLCIIVVNGSYFARFTGIDAFDKIINERSLSEISTVASTGSSLFSVSFTIDGEEDEDLAAKKI
jgi:hypothetical protein